MHNIVQLQKAILLCMARENYKIVFYTSSSKTKEDLLRYAMYDKTLSCVVKVLTGEICFENGSTIFLDSSDSIKGWDVNRVFIDDEELLTVDKVNYLRSRARK